MVKPKRVSVKRPDGGYDVTVTPPAWSGFSPTTTTLTESQHARYLLWVEGKMLIQAALPELDPATREQLLSGISPTEWDQKLGGE